MNKPMPDHYARMKIPRNATQEDISKAWKKLAKEYHPDVNNSKGKKYEERCKVLFQELNDAYETLKDPVRRQRYDQDYAEWKASAKEQAEAFRLNWSTFLKTLQGLYYRLLDWCRGLKQRWDNVSTPPQPIITMKIVYWIPQWCLHWKPRAIAYGISVFFVLPFFGPALDFYASKLPGPLGAPIIFGGILAVLLAAWYLVLKIFAKVNRIEFWEDGLKIRGNKYPYSFISAVEIDDRMSLKPTLQHIQQGIKSPLYNVNIVINGSPVLVASYAEKNYYKARNLWAQISNTIKGVQEIYGSPEAPSWSQARQHASAGGDF